MWISGFVVSLPLADRPAQDIVRALEAIPVFTLGERQASRLPVVLEAPDGSTARYWHEWVEQLPGVVQVEVAFVSFDETAETVTNAASGEFELPVLTRGMQHE